LGDASPNVLLTITLYDPDGNEVKVEETFSNKNGKISESHFRIPSEGISGMWSIVAKSGQNLDTIEIEVLGTLDEGIQISIEKGITVPTVGESVNIRIFGVHQNVSIDIIASDGKVIHTLNARASSQGEVNLPWIIPKETAPGDYTIKVTDAFGTAEIIYYYSIE